MILRVLDFSVRHASGTCKPIRSQSGAVLSRSLAVQAAHPDGKRQVQPAAKPRCGPSAFDLVKKLTNQASRGSDRAHQKGLKPYVTARAFLPVCVRSSAQCGCESFGKSTVRQSSCLWVMGFLTFFLMTCREMRVQMKATLSCRPQPRLYPRAF